MKFTMPDKDKAKLGQVLAYLEATNDDQWLMGRCRSADQKKNCLLGHVFAMGKDDKEGNEWVNWFDYIATEYMYFSINDGENPKYPQATPKQRCIAYLTDIMEGWSKSTMEMLDDDERTYKERKKA
jgi:hypothetical protein